MVIAFAPSLFMLFSLLEADTFRQRKHHKSNDKQPNADQTFENIVNENIPFYSTKKQPRRTLRKISNH